MIKPFIVNKCEHRDDFELIFRKNTGPLIVLTVSESKKELEDMAQNLNEEIAMQTNQIIEQTVIAEKNLIKQMVNEETEKALMSEMLNNPMDNDKIMNAYDTWIEVSEDEFIDVKEVYRISPIFVPTENKGYSFVMSMRNGKDYVECNFKTEKGAKEAKKVMLDMVKTINRIID